MILFSLPVRYFGINSNDHYGKYQRDTFVFGANRRSGEWIPACPCAFSAPALPCGSVKVKGLSSPKTAEKADLCRQSISKRVSGFLSAGIEGLENRPGQGSRPVISREAGEETVRKAVEAGRQGEKAAKSAWEASSGKTAPEETFRRFLSVLAQDINV
jgi:hypothetical protein